MPKSEMKPVDVSKIVQLTPSILKEIANNFGDDSPTIKDVVKLAEIKIAGDVAKKAVESIYNEDKDNNSSMPVLPLLLDNNEMDENKKKMILLMSMLGKDSASILPFLLLLDKKDGQTNTNTQNNQTSPTNNNNEKDNQPNELATLLPLTQQQGVDFNKVLGLIAMMKAKDPIVGLLIYNTINQQQQKPTKKVKKLEKKMQEMEQKLTNTLEEVRNIIKDAAERQQTQQVNTNPTIELITTLVTALVNAKQESKVSNADLLDYTDKLLTIMQKLQPAQPQPQSFDEALNKLTDLLAKLKEVGIISDEKARSLKEKMIELKEKELETKKELELKKLEHQKELIKQKLEAEKKLKEYELQRSIEEAKAKLEQVQATKEIVNTAVASIARGLANAMLETIKPEAQAQQPQPQQQTQQQNNTQPNPQPPDMVTIVHYDDKGNPLHQFDIPVKILTQNIIETNGVKYYSLTCPYDNEKLYIRADQYEEPQSNEENKEESKGDEKQ